MSPHAIHRRIRFLLALASCVFIVVSQGANTADAQILDWGNNTGSPSPLLQNAGNWSPATVPGAMNQLRFQSGATSSYEVNWNGSTQAIVPTVDAILVNEAVSVTFRDSTTAAGLRQLNLSNSASSLSVVDGSLSLDGIEVVAAGMANIGNDGFLSVGASSNAGGLTASAINVDGQLRVQGGSILNGRGVLAGRAVITGAGTTWNASSITIADNSAGRLEVADGARVVTDALSEGIGSMSTPSSLTLIVAGENSEVVVNGAVSLGINDLLGESDLTVLGATIRSGEVFLGSGAEVSLSSGAWISSGRFTGGGLIQAANSRIDSIGAAIDGNANLENNTDWVNVGDLDISQFGGADLDIDGGSHLSSTGGTTVHQFTGGTTTIDVTDNSQWTNGGTLTIEAGTVVVGGSSSLTSAGASVGTVSTGNVTIGNNSTWTITGLLSMAEGTLTVTGSSTLETDSSTITSGTVTVEGGSGWTQSGALDLQNSATLQIRTNGLVQNAAANVSDSNVTVVGANWITSGELNVASDFQTGSVTIEGGGRVQTIGASIVSGSNDVPRANVNVSGRSSQWINDGNLTIDGGLLTIADSGFVRNNDVSISSKFAFTPEDTGFVQRGAAVVNDAGWNIDGDLTFSGDLTSELRINSGATVTVAGLTSLGDAGSVRLEAGTFNFGRARLGDLHRFDAISGTLRGTLINDQVVDVATAGTIGDVFGSPFAPAVTLAFGSTLENSGTLYGTGRLAYSVNNLSDGQVELFTGDQMRFSGQGQNSGEINNFGGLVRFEGSLTNDAGGFIGGRGVFIANGGIQNSGVMAFTGTTDVLGDVEMLAGSQMVTSGFATTTLFDDVVFNDTPGNRAEIRTSEGSATVILGGISGDMNFTGTGTVFAEGDLRPGNSPGVGVFEGDFLLGDTAATFIELGGIDSGEFDQFDIAGDFGLGGSLDVSLIDGFSLGFGQEFLVADVEGSMTGMFSGLNEGSLVGNYGGQDLFITYNGFGGNRGVGLFTAVPEPSSGCVLLLCACALAGRRKRQR